MALDLNEITTIPTPAPSPVSTSAPAGWRIVRFGDVVRNVKTTVVPEESGLERYAAGEHMDTDNLHIWRWGVIGDGYLGPAFHRKFVKGQVLYGSRRTYLRKVAVANFDGICANTTFVVEPSGDDLLPNLLPFIMQTESFTQHSIKQSKGSVNPYINWSDLAWYEFALPPMDEQRRIADILWAADETVSKFAVVVDALVTAEDTYTREQFTELVQGVSGHVATLMTLGSVLSYASDGPFGSKLKTEHYAVEGARVIRLQNIGDGEFLDDDKAYISDAYYRDLSRYSLQPKDILVAGLGDETHPVGRVCQVPQWLGPAVNKADCFCLRVDESIAEAKYILYFLNSMGARQQVAQVSQGTTRLRVNVTNLKTILVPVPDRTLQLRVCKVLDELAGRSIQLRTDVAHKKVLVKTLRELLLNRKETSSV